ncbi:MAG: sterol desaturase family protein [Sandaracinaceae bacterium]|nr:sterol desaturase family protein [Sandaracinaceae bacterium]
MPDLSGHLLDHVPFHVAIGVTLFVDAVLMAFLSWAYRSPRFQARLLRAPIEMKVSKANYRWTVAVTGTLSTLSTIGLVYGLAPWTVSTSATPVWQIVLQGFGVLIVYDFAYYFMHRFMHIKALMPYVHAVHHRVRFPSALESLYLSPIEMLAGLGLLMAVTALIGPIHWTAFAAVFFVYSTLHIVIHSGMRFEHPAFGVINYLTLKHHKHHLNKHGHNYASVTPLPDLVFGTSI